MSKDFSEGDLRIIEAAAARAAENDQKFAAAQSHVLTSLVDSLAAAGVVDIGDFTSRLRRCAEDTKPRGENLQYAFLVMWIDYCEKSPRDRR